MMLIKIRLLQIKSAYSAIPDNYFATFESYKPSITCTDEVTGPEIKYISFLQQLDRLADG